MSYDVFWESYCRARENKYSRVSACWRFRLYAGSAQNPMLSIIQEWLFPHEFLHALPTVGLLSVTVLLMQKRRGGRFRRSRRRRRRAYRLLVL